MNSETLIVLAGVILAVAFDYVPGLKDWYDQQGEITKRQVMLACLVVAAAGVLVYQCRGDGACYGVNAEAVVTALVLALAANQGAHSLFKPKAK